MNVSNATRFWMLTVTLRYDPDVSQAIGYHATQQEIVYGTKYGDTRPWCHPRHLCHNENVAGRPAF